MTNDIGFAWRNVWRNKRRTIILSASIAFGLFFAIIMVGFQLGFYGQVVTNITQSYLGDIQIHSKGYWDEKIIDNSFDQDLQMNKELEGNRYIKTCIARLESFAFVSSGQQTKVALIIGTEIDKEIATSRLDEKIIHGKVLSNKDDGVLVSQGLAKFLLLGVNDTIVLLSQGYHGSGAAGKFPVRGIFHLPSPDLDNQMIYMSLPATQLFFNAENKVTSLVINLKNPKQINSVKRGLLSNIDTSTLEIMTWSQVAPELDRLIKSEQQNTYIFVGLLYLIIAFGIFGTVLMMTAERKREFGVVIAIGMQKSKLVRLMSIEVLLMGLIGIISGLIISLPIVYYFSVNPYRLGGQYGEFIKSYGFEPLLPLLWDAGYMINQCMVILLFTGLSAIYPTYKILSLEIIRALRK